MENEERHTSYAAAAGSKSTPYQNSESVLDSWEEAAQDNDRSQELERSIEEKLGKMKQKQSGMKPTASDMTSNHANDGGAFSATRQQSGESKSSADLSGGAAASVPIRILKRPQSSGHLPQQGLPQPNAPASDQFKPSTSTRPAVASSDGRYAKNGNVGRSSQQQQQRTLEERAAAYAEARMRIFGVADQQIHDDLPVQPKLSTMPQSNQGSPSSSSNANR